MIYFFYLHRRELLFRKSASYKNGRVYSTLSRLQLLEIYLFRKWRPVIVILVIFYSRSNNIMLYIMLFCASEGRTFYLKIVVENVDIMSRYFSFKNELVDRRHCVSKINNINYSNNDDCFFLFSIEEEIIRSYHFIFRLYMEIFRKF